MPTADLFIADRLRIFLLPIIVHRYLADSRQHTASDGQVTAHGDDCGWQHYGSGKYSCPGSRNNKSYAAYCLKEFWGWGLRPINNIHDSSFFSISKHTCCP